MVEVLAAMLIAVLATMLLATMVVSAVNIVNQSAAEISKTHEVESQLASIVAQGSVTPSPGFKKLVKDPLPLKVFVSESSSASTATVNVSGCASLDGKLMCYDLRGAAQ